MCIYIIIYIYILVYVCMCVYTCMYIYIYIYVYMYGISHLSVCRHSFICVTWLIYAFTCVLRHIHIYEWRMSHIWKSSVEGIQLTAWCFLGIFLYLFVERKVRMNMCVFICSKHWIFVIKSSMYADVFIYIFHDAARLCTICSPSFVSASASRIHVYEYDIGECFLSLCVSLSPSLSLSISLYLSLSLSLSLSFLLSLSLSLSMHPFIHLSIYLFTHYWPSFLPKFVISPSFSPKLLSTATHQRVTYINEYYPSTHLSIYTQPHIHKSSISRKYQWVMSIDISIHSYTATQHSVINQSHTWTSHELVTYINSFFHLSICLSVQTSGQLRLGRFSSRVRAAGVETNRTETHSWWWRGACCWHSCESTQDRVRDV